MVTDVRFFVCRMKPSSTKTESVKSLSMFQSV